MVSESSRGKGKADEEEKTAASAGAVEDGFKGENRVGSSDLSMCVRACVRAFSIRVNFAWAHRCGAAM